MRKNLCVAVLILASVLLGMGEKALVQGQEHGRSQVLYKDGETQFRESYSEYLKANNSKYPKGIDRSITMFENYLKHYPEHEKVNDALFILARLYKISGDNDTSMKYLDAYFSKTAEDDFYYRFARVDKASILRVSGSVVSANNILDDLLEKYRNSDVPEDIYFKRDLYVELLPIYKMNQDKEKQIEAYAYLTANKRFIKNKNLFYSYKYALAVLYIEKGEKDKAKKLLNEVAYSKEHNVMPLKDSAIDLLGKL